MQYNLSIDQQLAIEHELNLSESIVLSFIRDLKTWATQVVIDGITYFHITKQKLCDELPLVTTRKNSMKKIINRLAAKGVLDWFEEDGYTACRSCVQDSSKGGTDVTPPP